MGNTKFPCFHLSYLSVHPHACGEHIIWSPHPDPMRGSSPRMWGTLILSIVPIIGHRFIPTHVGNTAKPTMAVLSWPVHPHACGEHELLKQRTLLRHGSSPRMWGTRHAAWSMGCLRRFIPTHVGNTLVYACRHLPKAVHPHACGEHFGSPKLSN